jgi:hypothetical protein
MFVFIAHSITGVCVAALDLNRLFFTCNDCSLGNILAGHLKENLVFLNKSPRIQTPISKKSNSSLHIDLGQCFSN